MNKSEKAWDKLANSFDKVNKQFAKTHIKTVENTKKHLNISDIVLDYGCATGTVAIEIADKVKAVHGIDISSKMIEAARRKAAERQIENIDFAQSIIFDERLQKASFDVILAFNILHFLEDIPKVMQRLNELLKPGGLFISAVPCHEKWSLGSIFLPLLGKILKIPYMKFFKISELEEFITKGNFQIVETEPLTPTEYFIVAKKI